MPRVHISTKTYMLKDLSDWSIGRMRVQKKSQAYMGALLGISQVAYGQRLRSGNFEFGQLIAIFKELQATDEEIVKLMKM